MELTDIINETSSLLKDDVFIIKIVRLTSKMLNKFLKLN